jgi:hypothetical protein
LARVVGEGVGEGDKEGSSLGISWKRDSVGTKIGERSANSDSMEGRLREKGSLSLWGSLGFKVGGSSTDSVKGSVGSGEESSSLRGSLYDPGIIPRYLDLVGDEMVGA